MKDTPLPLGPGIHDISADAYHADPCATPSLSSTLARLILNRSPRHAWTAHPRLNPDYQGKESKTFDIGRAAHRAVLSKGGDYVAYPEHVLGKGGAASTAAAKEWAEEARARGWTPLKADEIDAVHDMSGEIMGRLAAMGITFPPARSELTAIAEIDGVMCRAMIDHAPEDPRQPLWDVKTTTDASPAAVMRTIMAYNYDVQAAHYCEVWKAATGEDRKFSFVFVEKDAPHECCVIQLGGDSMAMGRKRTGSVPTHGVGGRARSLRRSAARGRW
ncbi:PD-(D/E)XK nuclease-like domain-containing protein [Paracoccus shanxieyensis]|uniref:Putative exodeoxyribonuclease 8 PDDEXK-like domain-containing protein n=1 Tax=Paracoccus shanxieyensis TaxID=2675752 RepID=A0A6L6J4B9_9RHOB|nr:PD-(D/E)XK nuclease-like domain-containing protein [Paracoccus shanxieyensis]MTH66731.1 hypothetical protein [Paracoccus shanxieyensis]MTH89966.1 hypothetical protein [Paracoccus shanxieyensis]